MLYVDVLLYSEVFFSDYPHSTCIACHSKRHNNDQDAVERKEKETEFQKQQDEEIALKEKLNNLNDKDYIEKIARDDYYLSNKGEVIFRLPDDKNPLSQKTSNEKAIRIK